MKQVKCPECGGILGSPQYFVTMFKTNIGPYGEDPAYTRPEAAQGIFVDFHRVLEVMREKFPLGIAQVGTVLRNEISPRQGPIRLREFTIMDFEVFFDPEKPECPYLGEVNDDRLFIITEDTRKNGKSETTRVTTAEALEKRLVKSPWMAYFMAQSTRFLAKLGIEQRNQRFFEKLSTERAHYSAQTFDHEVKLDRWDWVEVAGFAYRTDYDLRSHMKATGIDMRVFKSYDSPVEKTVRTVRPNHEKIRKRFGSDAGRIISLLAKEDLPRILQGKKSGDSIRIEAHDIPIELFDIKDETVNEAGIPLGITVDYDTLKDDTVTLRDRDSWNQIRVKIKGLKPTIDSIVNSGFPTKTG